MLGHRDLTMEDYAGILKRRFWLILICSIAVLAIGVVISRIIPPQYESQTLVLIEQQKVPEDYVTLMSDSTKQLERIQSGAGHAHETELKGHRDTILRSKFLPNCGNVLRGELEEFDFEYRQFRR